MNTKAKDACWEVGPREIARTLGVTDSAVYAWLKRKVRPRWEVAQALAQLLTGHPKNQQGEITTSDIMVPSAPEPDGREDRRRVGKRYPTPQPQETPA